MKKTNAIQNEVKLLNSDVASANRIQIGNAISKAFEKHNKILNQRLRLLIEEMANLKAPAEKQLQDLRAESEGYARQSNHFVGLYRQCLADFKKATENLGVKKAIDFPVQPS